MILAASIPWLSITINLLLVLFVLVCLVMTLLVLMQRPKQEGLGAAFGGGVTDQVFGARTTNVLQRGTVYLASLFFILALTLSVLISHKNQEVSTVGGKPATEPAAKSAPPAPAEQPAPKSLSEELPPEPIPLAPAPADAPTTPDATPAPESQPQPAQPQAPAPTDSTAPAPVDPKPESQPAGQ
ncbi:MAG: preprotein translocase subunit SecG [Verrucomicrobiota bacterium]